MIFPDDQTLARAMFEEGVRHLDDARLLHLAARYPAAVASAMKGTELGFKAVLILEGAWGWWEGISTSHSPVTDANRHPALKSLVAVLPGLLLPDIIAMESLAPARLGKKAFGQNSQDQDEKNAEYPFIAYDAAQRRVAVVKPSDSFVETDSRAIFETARALLEELALHRSSVSQWNASIAPAL